MIDGLIDRQPADACAAAIKVPVVGCRQREHCQPLNPVTS